MPSGKIRRTAQDSLPTRLEERALGAVRRQLERPAVRRRGLGPALQASQHVGPRGVQVRVGLEGPVGRDAVHHREAHLGSVGHRDGDREVELDDRGRVHPGEGRVERRDLRPVRVGRRRGLVVERRDRRLELIRAGPAGRERPLHEGAALADPSGVPARPILVVEQDELALRADPGLAPGVVEEHQRQQPDASGSSGSNDDHDPGQPDRLDREFAPDQARRRTRRCSPR